MSHELINLNRDLSQLVEDGLEVEIRHDHLLVHHIPYVTSGREIKRGILVSELSLSGKKTIKPSTHVMLFSGEFPCNRDGTHISQLKHESSDRKIGEDLMVNHSFSNKPQNGYGDYYEKFTSYIRVISSPAKSIDDTVTEKTYKPPKASIDSVFRYVDTNSSRGEITAISAKLANQHVAIVGLGGTGSYVLDLLAKTPVREICLFDGDIFQNHNAFRAPGAAALEVIQQEPAKTEYLKSIYSAMHTNINSIPEPITEKNVERLLDCTFVFICMDSGPAKRLIVERLIGKGIPFVDTGMGVEVVKDADTLIGIVRTTTGAPAKYDHLSRHISYAKDGNDLYSQNVQIAELNALNAAFAVIKWKKLLGFYQDLGKEHSSLFTLNTGELHNDETIN
jgi:hypothetical protein